VAASGGVVALFLSGTDFSISAAMGFISILGVSIQDALLVVTSAQQLRKQGQSAESAARRAAQRWLRPVLMASTVAMLGLLPAALSRGIGSETQKPLAIVVIAGHWRWPSCPVCCNRRCFHWPSESGHNSARWLTARK